LGHAIIKRVKRRGKIMNKLKILRKELDDMIENDRPYEEIIVKSKELDYYITKEMQRMNKNEIKVEY
jgi:hypothetical protein